VVPRTLQANLRMSTKWPWYVFTLPLGHLLKARLKRQRKAVD
jgi:hypothetical protein